MIYIEILNEWGFVKAFVKCSHYSINQSENRGSISILHLILKLVKCALMSSIDLNENEKEIRSPFLKFY